MPEQKRVRRTAEQMADDIDLQIEKLEQSLESLAEKKAALITEADHKIAAVKTKIAALRNKKKSILAPKKRKTRKSKSVQIQALVKQAQKSGLKLDEIAQKLGVALEGA